MGDPNNLQEIIFKSHDLKSQEQSREGVYRDEVARVLAMSSGIIVGGSLFWRGGRVVLVIRVDINSIRRRKNHF